MNAIERSDRRVKRKVVLKRIYEIEYANCRKCPNRRDQKRTYCEDCPVYNKLTTCGQELISLTSKEPQPKPVIVKPVRTENRKKKELEHYMVFTRNVYIKDRAAGLHCDDFTEKYDIALTTLKRYVRTWGLQRLTKEKAKEMLLEMESAI